MHVVTVLLADADAQKRQCQYYYTLYTIHIYTCTQCTLQLLIKRRKAINPHIQSANIRTDRNKKKRFIIKKKTQKEYLNAAKKNIKECECEFYPILYIV